MQEKLKFILFIFISTNIYCQIPTIEYNYFKKDSLDNPLLKTFLKDYEFVFAYSDQCCSKQYKILAFKNKKWEILIYSNNFVQYTKKRNEEKTTIDTITTGTFLERKKIKSSTIEKLLSKLTENNFWKLENDSLNQTRVIETYKDFDGETIIRKAYVSDGTNYVFDIMSNGKCRVIKSYSPEYFVQLFPNMTDRKRFIENKDYFIKWWEKYSR